MRTQIHTMEVSTPEMALLYQIRGCQRHKRGVTLFVDGVRWDFEPFRCTVSRAGYHPVDPLDVVRAQEAAKSQEAVL